MKKQFPILVLLALIVCISCDRPKCNNTNPIFDKFEPLSNEYKRELLDQLDHTDNSLLTYWLDKYEENSQNKYLYVNVQSENLCAIMVLDVKAASKGIDNIIKNKGKGYIGAELCNVSFYPVRNETGIRMELISVGAIKD